MSFTTVFAMIAVSIEAGDYNPQLTNPSNSKSDKDDPVKLESLTPKIAFVFFAQTHVLPPESDYFRLVSNRDALIEAQAYSKSGANAPNLVALLTLNGKSLELPLKGPSVLPKPRKDPLLPKFRDAIGAEVKDKN